VVLGIIYGANVTLQRYSIRDGRLLSWDKLTIREEKEESERDVSVEEV
jgi:hypothetical protein